MRIPEAQLAKAVGELQKEGGIPARDLAQAFGSFLRRKRFARRAGKIARALDAYVENESKVVRASVTSARPLSPLERVQIEAAAATLLGKPNQAVALEFYEDPSVIGGIRLETADTRYDSTVARAVRELHKSL